MSINNFDSGRSMVEMLGTLAIIGVLSVGAIAGYSYGMDKYRANQTINDVNLRIVDLIAQANRGGDLSLSEWPTKSTAGYDIGLEKDATTSKNTGGIQVSSVPNRVCEFLGEMTDVSNITLKITGTDYTKGACGEENVMVFFQSDVVNGIGGTQPCNGPVVDGVCQPCEDGRMWNSTYNECLCEDTSKFLAGTECTSCPCNATVSTDGKSCVCPEGYTYDSGFNTCDNADKKFCPLGQDYNTTADCRDCPSNSIPVCGGCQCPDGSMAVLDRWATNFVCN